MKANKLIEQILNEINVRASEAPLEDDEVQDTIFHTNAYMQALAADGVDLGWTDIVTLSDDITSPDGAAMGIIANVAIVMAPTFGAVVSPALAAKAAAGLKIMEKLGVTIGDADYGSTLPIGSGNEGTYGNDYGTFYDRPASQIEKETEGAIILEGN